METTVDSVHVNGKLPATFQRKVYECPSAGGGLHAGLCQVANHLRHVEPYNDPTLGFEDGLDRYVVAPVVRAV